MVLAIASIISMPKWNTLQREKWVLAIYITNTIKEDYHQDGC